MIKKLLLIALFLTCPSLVHGVLSQTKEEFCQYVKAFVEQGGDVNATIATDSDLASTLLHYAAEYGYTESAQYLLERGAQVNALDSTQQTPLHRAVINGHIGMIDVLISRHANVNARDIDQNAPLHYLADVKTKGASAKIARILIAAKADVNAENENHDTPLHLIAAEEEDKGELSEAVQVLLDAGADPCKVDDEGTSVFQVAVQDADSVAFSRLLDKAPNLDESDSQGDSLLHRACGFRDLQKIELLIAKGANLMVKNDNDQTPLMAFLKGRAKQGEAANGKSQEKKGCYLSDAQLVELLLTMSDESRMGDSDDSYMYDKDKNNLLHHAFRYPVNTSDNEILMLILRQARHLINAANKDDNTPLYFALMNGDVSATMMLLRAGADPEIRDHEGATHLGRLLFSEKLGGAKKLKLARLLMMYSSVFKDLLLKDQTRGEVKLTTMNQHQLQLCGIDSNFVKEVMSPESFDECHQELMAAYGTQEYGMKKAPSVMRALQQRELTGRWHPYNQKR